MNINQIVNNYVTQGVAKAAAAGYKVPSSPIIVNINKRLTTVLGRASLLKKGQTLTLKIDINGKAYTEDSTQLRETVLHEVAHLLAYLHDGTIAHNNTWARFMRFFGLSADVKASTAKLEAIGYKPERKATRNLVSCTVCDRKYTLTNKQHSELTSYRCKCGNKLKCLNAKVAPGQVK